MDRLGSRARFQTSQNCLKVSEVPRRFVRWMCQSWGEMRPSCQSNQWGSFSIADQTSCGVSGSPEAKPVIAREMSTRISTRPISKMMARNLDDTNYLISVS